MVNISPASMRCLLLTIVAMMIGNSAILPAAVQQPARKIVLIAGVIDVGHPRGVHEYQKTVRRFARDLIPLGKRLNFSLETHFGGWPEDPSTLDDADTILLVSDGRDRDSAAHPFLVDNRLEVLQRQVDRGCGMVMIHWSTFWPETHRDRILDWTGGYFDYQSGPPPRGWFSKIRTFQSDCIVATPGHPAANGVDRFPLREEFYYNLRFANPDRGNVIPLLQTRVVEMEDLQTVAWAFERSGGGRGFSFTGGHFFSNWDQPDLRKLVENGILWTAGIGVPPRGVVTRDQTLPPGTVDVLDAKRINAVLITGNQHPAHDWRATSAVLTDAVSQDPRVAVDQKNIDFLEDPRLQDYDTILFNYCNWKQPGLSEAAKRNFSRFLQRGGGLVLVHFANGAFHRSLPDTPDSDWPEYRKICRRVWDHAGGSGHDAYGPFEVRITQPQHPVATGVTDFGTVDELYYRQVGDLPIDVIATARSTVTGNDEPMAFTYEYGKGKVFQTVLGHAAESIRVPGTSRLIRNAVAWTAGRDAYREPSGDSALQRLGPDQQALNARLGFARVETEPPAASLDGRSVACRAKLASAADFNILVAQHPKTSQLHWELYSYRKSGRLSLYLPGFTPAEIVSDANVCDNQWHELDAEFDGQTVVLRVDGKEVKRQAVTASQLADRASGPLTIGALASQQHGCDGLIDWVRFGRMDDPSAGQLGTWDFEQPTIDQIVDRSPLGQSTEFLQTGIKADYLEKWTPRSRTDSRFPYENETDEDWVDDRFSSMDTGPLFSYSIRVPGRGMIPKALAVRGPQGSQDHWIYNPEKFRVEAGWTGDFLALPPARFGILKMPTVSGTIDYRCDPDAGWSWGSEEGAVVATAENSSLVSYRPTREGLHLTYEFNGRQVEESIRSEIVDGVRVMQRLIHRSVDDAADPLRLMLGSTPRRWVYQRNGVAGAVDPKQAMTLELAPGETELRLTYADVDDVDRGQKLLARLKPITMEREGAPGWGKPVITRGVLGSDDGPFAVDTITLPDDNPYGALMFVSGFDFLPDGRAAVCTVHGDVWLVEGIDADLDELRWHRYASGLYQPLGLKVVGEDVFVICRDRLVRFEIGDTAVRDRLPTVHNFNDDLVVTGQSHAYAMSLETDPQGNFYFIKSGGTPPHGGTMLRIGADGNSLEVVATGYRHANGMGISPSGVVTSADNEGNWIPSTRIDVVTPGGFYGHMPTHRRAVAPETYDPPMIWLPREMDNSAGGQVWIQSPSWDRLNGSMIHLSYGRCTANVVLPQQLSDSLWQAAAYRLEIPAFISGAMRGRFHPRDGHLYVGGLDGWQTAAVRDGCFQRVRTTGKPFYHPVGFEVRDDQLEIEFPQPLDPQSVEQANWQVEQWNYRYSETYGSDHYRVSDPDQVGHDAVDVKSVGLSDDGRTVTLTLSDLKPVMQMNLQANLKAADGHAFSLNLFNTIHSR